MCINISWIVCHNKLGSLSPDFNAHLELVAFALVAMRFINLDLADRHTGSVFCETIHFLPNLCLDSFGWFHIRENDLKIWFHLFVPFELCCLARRYMNQCTIERWGSDDTQPLIILTCRVETNIFANLDHASQVVRK